MHIPKSIVVTADYFVMSPSDAWNIYSFICRPCPNLPLRNHSFQCYFPGAITNDCFALSNEWFWCSLSGKVSTSGNDIIYCIDWSLHRMVSMEIWLKWSCQYYANLIYKKLFNHCHISFVPNSLNRQCKPNYHLISNFGIRLCVIWCAWPIEIVVS